MVNLLAAISSAVLVVISFPPRSLSPLLFVALVPLLLTLRNATAWAAFHHGFGFGAALLIAGFYWVWPAIERAQEMSALTALPFFLVFVAYHALQFALFAALSRPGGAARVASAWVAAECFWPRILPWTIADGLGAIPLLSQPADLAGAFGLSWLIVFANAEATAAVASLMQGSRRDCAKPAVVFALTLSAITGYGAWRMHALAVVDRAVRVAIVQGGLTSGRRDLERANAAAFDTYAALTTNLTQTERPDLIVWPETTLRVYLRHDRPYRARVRKLVQGVGVPLLLGSLDLPEIGRGEINSAYLFSPRSDDDGASGDSEMLERIYRKRELLPFGEYLPAKRWLGGILAWRTTGDFISAPSDVVMNLPPRRSDAARAHVASIASRQQPGLSIAPSICFEALQPGAFNQAVRDGAEILVNLTDDGWFPPAAEPKLHLNGTRLRAIETRRWLVRASNSGISAFISPTGEVTDSLPVGASATLAKQIEAGTTITPYVALGNWLAVVCCAHVLVVKARLIPRFCRKVGDDRHSLDR